MLEKYISDGPNSYDSMEGLETIDDFDSEEPVINSEQVKRDMVWEIEGGMHDCLSNNKRKRRDKMLELFELSNTSKMAAEAVSEAIVEKFGDSLERITHLEDFDLIIKEMREIGLVITDEMLRAMKENAIAFCNFDSVHIKGDVKQADKIRDHFAEKYKL